MPPSATVLLTGTDPGVAERVGRLRPDLTLVPIGSSVPAQPLPGPVYGFIDWLLPDISGLELCRRLRRAESTRDAHLTMVLDSADAADRRNALNAGADDYLPGPLTAEALLDRIDAGLGERPRASEDRRLQHGELSVDLAAYQARFRGRPVPLRRNEFRLLVHFLENRDQVLSRASLIAHIGKPGEEIEERTVDVWAGRLRRALRSAGAPDPLRTVRTLGYVMDSCDRMQ
jgi:two-component system phosphate regulon response regulator PhoB